MLELVSSRFASSTVKKLSTTRYRKEIMSFGTYQDPNPWNWGEEDELWEVNEEYCQAVIDNFKAGAVESVKVIITHDEGDVQIVGTIVNLELTSTGLDAIIDIEDEELRSQIDTVMGDGKPLASGVSVGISEMFPRSRVESGQGLFWDGPVLRHLAIVTIPWIQGMRQWEKIDRAAGNSEKINRPLFRTEEVIENMKFADLVKNLATRSGKTEDEVIAGLEALGVTAENFEKKASNKDKKSKKTPDAQSVERLLEMLGSVVDDDEDEDDEDDDEDEESKGKNKAAGTKRTKRSKNAGTKSKASRSRNAGTRPNYREMIQEEIGEALAPVLENMRTLGTALQGGLQSVKESQEEARSNKAASAVDGLIGEGKLLPKDREHYIALHLKDEELFEALTKDLEVKVDFTEEPVGSTVINPQSKGKKLSSEEAIAEAERYLGMVDPSKGSGRSGRASDMAKK